MVIYVIYGIILHAFVKRKKEVIHIVVKTTELVLLLSLAIISDIKTYKIKNAIILTFLAAGLFTNFITGDLSLTSGSVIAAIFPIILLFPLFILRMLGAGDIKLFSAVGAIWGIQFVFYSMIFSFLSGGVMALIIMLVNGSIRERGAYLLTYIKSCFLTCTLHSYSDFNKRQDGSHFRFSFAAACGSIITLFISFLL